MNQEEIEINGVKITADVSEFDGAIVIFIDTPPESDDVEPMRVYINDGKSIFNNTHLR